MCKISMTGPKLLMIIAIVLTILSLYFTSTSADDHEEYYNTYSKPLYPKKLGHTREKITHLHFYFHDIFSGKNRTSVQVAGPPLVNSSPNFGAVVVIDDPLTVGPKRTSKQVGSAQGFYAAAGQSEIGLLMVFNCVFTEGKFNGSTLSILGHNAILSAVREMPIVGGSGLFRFAKGYAEARTYVFNTSTTSLDAVVEYNVYVFLN